jgi:phenol 2-monooxygenase
VAREFVNNLPFTCGLTIQYEPSALTGAPPTRPWPGLDIGKRFHSAPVVRLADAKPMHLGHCIEADARFRLFLFAPAGDTGRPAAPRRLCDWLERDPASPLRRHTAPGEDIDAVIDTRAVFQQASASWTSPPCPRLLRPQYRAPRPVRLREGVLCRPEGRRADIFALRGIDRNAGCMVIVRPDQHVGQVLPLHFVNGRLARSLNGLAGASYLDPGKHPLALRSKPGRSKSAGMAELCDGVPPRADPMSEPEPPTDPEPPGSAVL